MKFLRLFRIKPKPLNEPTNYDYLYEFEIARSHEHEIDRQLNDAVEREVELENTIKALETKKLFLTKRLLDHSKFLQSILDVSRLKAKTSKPLTAKNILKEIRYETRYLQGLIATLARDDANKLNAAQKVNI